MRRNRGTGGGGGARALWGNESVRPATLEHTVEAAFIQSHLRSEGHIMSSYRLHVYHLSRSMMIFPAVLRELSPANASCRSGGGRHAQWRRRSGAAGKRRGAVRRTRTPASVKGTCFASVGFSRL